MGSTEYGYAISIGRRWPVRHHSGLSMERTARPKWWYPHRPKRKRYPWRRHYNYGHYHGCWKCNARKSHPWWDCEFRSEWELRKGWTSSREHQWLKSEAQHRWRHQSKALLRQGDYDTLPYQSVDGAW